MPLLWLSLAFLTGDITASFLNFKSPFWMAGCAAALAWSILSYSVGKIPRLSHLSISIPYRLPLNPLTYPVLLLALMAGGWRHVSAQPVMKPGFIGYHAQAGERVVVEGLVSRPPAQNDRYLSVEVQPWSILLPDGTGVSPVRGKLLVTMIASRRIEYGDLVRLEGNLELPTEMEDFSYRSYLAGRGTYAVMGFPKVEILAYNQGNPAADWVYRLRSKGVETLYRMYPDPEASLLAGILLGDEQGIPKGVEDAFRATGTSHIIVISGFNISIVAGLLFALFNTFFRRWWGTLLTVIGIAFYAVLVGGEAPVVRAAVMGSLAITGKQIGRSENGFNSLCFTAGVMTFVSPGLPAQVSFQLSFMATLGMMLYGDPWTERFKAWLSSRISAVTAQKISGLVSEGIIVTLAAQVLTLPLILYHFGRLSLVSLIANPLILPVQPQVMIFGGISAIAGLFSLTLGKLIGAIAWTLTAYTIRMVELLAKLPSAELPIGPIAPGFLIAFFTVLLFWTFQPERFKALARKISPAVPLAGLGIGVVFVWGFVFSAPDGRLHVTLLDTASQGIDGQALLVETPQGRKVLIGGGPSAKQLSDQFGRRLAFRKDIDWLVIPVPGKGRLDGLVDIVERYPPGGVLWAGEMRETSAARRLYDSLADAGIPVTAAQAGQSLDLGDGGRLEVLAVGKEGADLMLVWGNFRLLVPAGEQIPDVIAGVSAVLLPGNVLLSPEQMRALNPQLVLVSGLREDARLWSGYTFLSTIENGWIEVTTDGEEMWVQVER